MRRFPAGGVWYMWSNIRDDVKKLGGNIDNVGLHTLRHTYITRLALGGLELQRLSMSAGHSDVSITAKRYSHLNVESFIGGVDTLSNPASGDNSLPHDAWTVQRNPHDTEGNRAQHGKPTVK